MLDLLGLDKIAHATREHGLGFGVASQPCCVPLGLFPSLSGLRVFLYHEGCMSLDPTNQPSCPSCPPGPIWVFSPRLFTHQQGSPAAPTFSRPEPGAGGRGAGKNQLAAHLSVPAVGPSHVPALTPRLQLLGGRGDGGRKKGTDNRQTTLSKVPSLPLSVDTQSSPPPTCKLSRASSISISLEVGEAHKGLTLW